MRIRSLTLFVLACALGVSGVTGARAAQESAASAAVPGLVRNLVTDYGADPGLGGAQVAELLQRAVDDVGAAGGGTVFIPGMQKDWPLDRPVFVGYPNVTIAGEGTATRISGTPTMFVLGIKRQYPQAISREHFPHINGDAGVLDDSVKGSKYGLRTFNGKVRAAGFFPVCVLAYGGKIQTRAGDDYWQDYERGVNKPVYWQNDSRYTLNLAVKNNGAGVMKGTICGVGAGALTLNTAQGNIDDPLTIWTIESDPHTGDNLAFKFKVLDAQGRENMRSLLLSAAPVGPGVLRISVQLDFLTGSCRAWCSLSTVPVLPPVLTAKLELGAGYKFKAFQYGAFRLGAVTDSPFSGTPSDGTATNGDWTFCGLSLFKIPLYSLNGMNDMFGEPQRKYTDDTSVPDDTDRYFSDWGDNRTLLTLLPLNDHLPRTLVHYVDGRGCDDAQGYGYWLPDRPLQPIGGTIAVKNIALDAPSTCWGTPIAIGEASHALIQGVSEWGGACHGVGSWDCNPPNNLVELHSCRLMAFDAMFYGKSEDLRVSDVLGGGSEADFRLVGCRGEITDVLITAFLAADYYVKLHAGPYGGPLTFNYFCVDNEGMSYVPKKAGIYAEPSFSPGPEGNRITFRGGYYSGFMPAGSAVVELADPPGAPTTPATGNFSIDYIDLGSDPRTPCDCIVRCKSNRWHAVVQNTDAAWTTRALLASGLVRYEGIRNQGQVVTYQSDAAVLPSKGTWLAGSHIIRLPKQHDAKTGAWTFTEYRCVQSGTYGSKQEPKWAAAARAE